MTRASTRPAPEHLIATRRRVEPERLIRPAQRVPQMPHPRRDDLQRLRPSSRVQTEVQLALPGREPLPRGRLQCLQLGLVMRRTEMLDLARTPPRGMHDLHRGCSRRRPHRAHIRHDRAAYDPRLVRKFNPPDQQNPRSQRYSHVRPAPLIKLGCRSSVVMRAASRRSRYWNQRSRAGGNSHTPPSSIRYRVVQR
jgi:hypothetical protein